MSCRTLTRPGSSVMMGRRNKGDRIIAMTARKRRKRMIIAGIIIAVLIVLLVVTGFVFAGFSMGIRPQTLEQARAWQEEHYDLSWYDPLEKTDYTVTRSSSS